MKEYTITYDIDTDGDFIIQLPGKKIYEYGRGKFTIKALDKKDLFYKLKNFLLKSIIDDKNKNVKKYIKEWIDEQKDWFLEFGDLMWHGNWYSTFYVENWENNKNENNFS